MEELSIEKIIDVWNWFQNCDIFFYREHEGNLFNCPHQMLKCFNVLLLCSQTLYIHLKEQRICLENGICGYLQSFLNLESHSINNDEVIEIIMGDSCETFNFIEISRVVKIKDIFDSKTKPIILHGFEYLNLINQSYE